MADFVKGLFGGSKPAPSAGDDSGIYLSEIHFEYQTYSLQTLPTLREFRTLRQPLYFHQLQAPEDRNSLRLQAFLI